MAAMSSLAFLKLLEKLANRTRAKSSKNGLLLYRVYQKKGNRTLQCSSVFIIQSTEIILSQVERPGF